MAQTKNECRDTGIGLKPQPALEGAHVVEGLVDHRQTNDGVNGVAADADVKVHPDEHRGGVPDGKQAHIQANVLEPVEVEDHPKQEQDVVITGNHVLGTQVCVGNQVDARNLLDIALVTLGDSMCQHIHRHHGQHGKQQQAKTQGHAQPSRLQKRIFTKHENSK